MPNNKNCPNCGAPYNIELNKCPYCHTSYYDLSALDFTSNEPFYLKIKTTINGKPCYITQLVRPVTSGLSMTFNSCSTDVYDCMGSKLFTSYSGRTLSTNIEFEAVVTNKYKNLCTIEMEE